MRNEGLGSWIARRNRMLPGSVAVVYEGRKFTYEEMQTRITRLAHALRGLGVRRGERVAYLGPNHPAFLETFFATGTIGAVFVPLSFRLAVPELAYILHDSDVRVLVHAGEFEETATGALREAPVAHVVRVAPDGSFVHRGTDLTSEAPEAAIDESVSRDETALVMYTSGTTGRPKGAMLTHQNLVANTINWSIEMEARPGDVWLSGLPLFHIGGVNGVLPFIYVAGTSVITPSTNFDPLESLRLLEKHRATMCYFVPTQWQQICSLPEAAETDTSVLRRALWGASQAPPSTLELLVKTFPSVGIVNAFGQTEMSSNTCFLKADDAVRKMGSVGLPAVNVEVRIVDTDGEDVQVGDVGEIVYRGPTVMKGYYKKPDATQDCFRGGWFHSGDLVRQDDEGFIYVVDRVKDMIISGGENIYPAEVERAVERHPAVREVAVIGVPHPRWVETPVAVVVADGEDHPEAAEVLEFIKSDLASYKKPSAVVYVEELPRNASGKILKRDLRDSYEHLFEDQP
jgi:fatty-acyl-CoA synthase